MKAHDTIDGAAIDAMTMTLPELHAMIAVLEAARIIDADAFRPFCDWLPVYEEELTRRGL